MKIVSWNCNGALRRKFEYISKHQADLYIIQECENPQESNHLDYQSWAKNYIWIGDSKHKGLAVFARPEIQLRKLSWPNTYEDQLVKHFLPCNINEDFNLLAIWTHYNNSPSFGYIGQLWKYLQLNKSQLKKSILVGDFNSNSIWDKKHRTWNHSNVVDELKEIQIESLYHLLHNENHGQELTPSFYLQRKLDKPYHIDYIFGSRFFYERLENIEIGKPEEWLQHSDHMPIHCGLTY